MWKGKGKQTYHQANPTNCCSLDPPTNATVTKWKFEGTVSELPQINSKTFIYYKNTATLEWRNTTLPKWSR